MPMTRPRSDLVRRGTPVEVHHVDGRPVYVKREDECVGEARFSKLRGVHSHLLKIEAPHVAVLDTFHSKAGWGTAYIGGALGKRVTVFFPVYRGETRLREPQHRARRLGATLVPFPAGRSCILYHRAKREVEERHGADGYLLPNGLKLVETVEETATEVETVDPNLRRGATWVVSVSSGTIAAGVVRGLSELGADVELVLHMGYSRSEAGLLGYIEDKAGQPGDGVRLRVVDEGFDYKDAVKVRCPFPCNPYYDLKAWRWIVRNRASLGDRVVFWNIGA